MAVMDWYEHRHELCQGQVFRAHDGSIVMLDRVVPGDGTRWYVADWSNGWSYYDTTIEPGDLKEQIDGATLAAQESQSNG